MGAFKHQQAMFKMMDRSELELFVQKVERLREEQLSKRDIARRLGVPVATINDRLRKFRGVAQSGPERSVRDGEVGGSNPLTPTEKRCT